MSTNATADRTAEATSSKIDSNDVLITATVIIDGVKRTGTEQRPWSAVVNAIHSDWPEQAVGIDWDNPCEDKWTATAGDVFIYLAVPTHTVVATGRYLAGPTR